MKQSIRVGLCGFGFMGKTHLYALSNLPYFYDLPYRAEVIGVCTAHRETADAAAEAFGIRRVYACEADMIADGDIDVIDICTPNPCHFTTARAAISAGKHVLCEKPLTASAEESRELAQLAASTGLTCGVVFNNRFLSPVLRARQLAEEGRLGRILSFDFAYRHNSCIDPERTVGWKQRATCGGGTLADLGPHVIDLCRLLCGEIVSVMGKSQIAFPTHRVPEGEWLTDADEAFYLTATTASGAVGQITVSKLTQGANDELTFSVYGTEGAVRFDLMQPNYLYVYVNDAAGAPLGGLRGFTRVECVGRFDAPALPFPSPKAPIGWLRGHIGSMEHYLSAVYAHRSADPSFADGAAVDRIIAAARRSDAEGREVPV